MVSVQSVARTNYRHYAGAIGRVSRSSEKLARGEKLITFNGASDLALADRIRRDGKVNESFLPSIYEAQGMVALQENTVTQIKGMYDRIYELAILAQDTTRTSADLIAFHHEMSSLVNGMCEIYTAGTWANVSPLATTALNVNIGIQPAGNLVTDNYELVHNASGIGTLVAGFAGLSCSTLAHAAALSTVMATRDAAHATSDLSGHIAGVMAAVGKNMRKVETALGNRLAYINTCETMQEAFREIDPIKEVANFTAESVKLNTAQVVQTQANNLVSALNRFLQSM
jgi:flagellin-like hook-associated protein FlgL